MSRDVLEVEIRNLPSEAPAWAIHLQHSVNVMIRLQVETLRELGRVDRKLTMTDRSIDEVLAGIADESNQIDGLTHLTDDLYEKVLGAINSAPPGTVPADVQAKITAAFDAVAANKAKIMAAINKDTPAAAVDPSQDGTDAGTGSTGSDTGTTDTGSGSGGASGGAPVTE